MNEKIAMENLFKAKAVGETQVSRPVLLCLEGHNTDARPKRTLSSVDDVNSVNAHTTKCKRDRQMSL